MSVIRPYAPAALIASLLALSLVPAHAAPQLVTSRPALGGTDFLDWGTVGADGVDLGSSFHTTSHGGVGIDVSDNHSFILFEQGNGFGGNFAPGDQVLTNEHSGPDTISFNTSVSAVGFQIQDVFGGNFTATLSAYDSSNNLLGSFNENGLSTIGAGDNSAIFLGVKDSSADIAKIVFNTPSGWFGINRMDLTPGPPVPETSSILGLGSMVCLGGLLLIRRKRATI